MAQINLLTKSASGRAPIGSLVGSIAVKVIFAIFIGVIGYYAYLFYAFKQKSADIIKIQNEIKDKQEKIRTFDKRDEIITRQGQLSELKELYRNQLFWSKIIPELSRVTLKTAQYLNFTAAADGKVTLSAQVPGYGDLDKFLSVFDLPEYNRCIMDVKLNSTSKGQTEGVLLQKFDVTLKLHPALYRGGGQSPTASSSTICK